MRKAVAILALCCLLFLTAGYHLFYHLRIAEAKREMKEMLLRGTPEGLTKFVFYNNELKTLEWEGGSEFRYKGEMYDVVKTIREKGKTVIWCLADEKETLVLEHYLQAQKQTSEHSTSTIVLKLLAMQYLPCAELRLSTPDVTGQLIATAFLLRLPTEPSPILTPPPQVC